MKENHACHRSSFENENRQNISKSQHHEGLLDTYLYEDQTSDHHSSFNDDYLSKNCIRKNTAEFT